MVSSSRWELDGRTPITCRRCEKIYPSQQYIKHFPPCIAANGCLRCGKNINEGELELHLKTCVVDCAGSEGPGNSVSDASAEPPGDGLAGALGADKFPCRFCPLKVFNTQRGLSQHMSKMHPLEWNEDKMQRMAGEYRQITWSDSDHELLCIGEQEYNSLLLSGGKGNLGINQYLQRAYFPDATVLAISSQRKRDTFKRYVAERLERIKEMNVDSSNSVADAGPEGGEEMGAVLFENLEQNEVNEIKSKPHGEDILSTYKDLTEGKWGDAFSKASRVFSTLASQFKGKPTGKSTTGGSEIRENPNGTPRRKRKRKSKGTSSGRRVKPSKAKRRALYARVQKQWKQDRKGIVNKILDDRLEIEGSPSPTTDEQHSFWSTLFERQSPPDNGPMNGCKASIDDLECPLTKSEVSEALKKANDAAAGPDGVPLSCLKQLGSTSLWILYNAMWMKSEIPHGWKAARTVLIPKTDGAATPSDFRPISISSYFYRVYSATINCRLGERIKFDSRQRGFIKQDGVRDNIELLECLIDDAKRSLSNLHLSFMDVRKAFDSVSHASIQRALEWAGVPGRVRKVIGEMYTDCTTTVGAGIINVNRGVKQGDPLSSFLFNLVLEMALSRIPVNLGINFEGHKLCYMAFADDLILLARSEKALQKLVELVAAELRLIGLEFNVEKCNVLSITADLKRKASIVDINTKITIGDVRIPNLGMVDTYRYLGISIGIKGAPRENFVKELTGYLDNIARAPLKPNQKLHILRTHAIPRLQHRLLFSKVAQTSLSQMDKAVRKNVREWLKLPEDTSTKAFYADVASGGLGLICLERRVPLQKISRMDRLRASDDEIVRLLINRDPVNRRMVQWKKRCKFGGKSYSTKEELRDLYRSAFYATPDGRGLYANDSRVSKMSARQLVGPCTALTPTRFISAIGTRLGTLQTYERKHRGRQHDEAIFCDKGGCHEKVASLGHISQTCSITHGLRVRRHNRIRDRLAKALERKKSVEKVLVEEKLKLQDGSCRQPDIIVYTGTAVEIIDCQVKADMGVRRNLENDQNAKLERYGGGMTKSAAEKALGIGRNSVPFTVSAFTVTLRGQYARHTIDLAGRLALKSMLPSIAADVMADTAEMFVFWNRTTGVT